MFPSIRFAGLPAEFGLGGCKMCVSSYYSSLAAHARERDRDGNKEGEINQEELAVNDARTVLALEASSL